jgi:ABC-type sugar transport system ATPase subunit
VAGFIGSPSANLIAGQIKRTGEGYAFTRGGLTLPLPGKWNTILNQYGEAEVIAGIRPDTIVRRGTQVEFEVGAQNTLEGKIEFIEPLLGETIVGIDLGEGISVTASLQEIWEAEPGTTIELVIDLDRVMLFNPKTELSLMAKA